MAGTLYIVATPIGNLDDMPPRVAATFGAADFIAAEDTRVTMKLLNFLGLKKPMVSYYEHALQKGEGILRRIEAGESCALCSDAGMPCVSDPGEGDRAGCAGPGHQSGAGAGGLCLRHSAGRVRAGHLPLGVRGLSAREPQAEKERLAELLQEKRTTIFTKRPTSCAPRWTIWPMPLAQTAASPCAGS